MSFYPKQTRPRECQLRVHDAVEIVHGRKVPLGIKGHIFWISAPQRYGQSRFATTTYRIGIRDAQDQVHWTYDYNVRVIEREGKPVVELSPAELVWPTPELFSDR